MTEEAIAKIYATILVDQHWSFHLLVIWDSANGFENKIWHTRTCLHNESNRCWLINKRKKTRGGVWTTCCVVKWRVMHFCCTQWQVMNYDATTLSNAAKQQACNREIPDHKYKLKWHISSGKVMKTTIFWTIMGFWWQTLKGLTWKSMPSTTKMATPNLQLWSVTVWLLFV